MLQRHLRLLSLGLFLVSSTSVFAEESDFVSSHEEHHVIMGEPQPYIPPISEEEKQQAAEMAKAQQESRKSRAEAKNEHAIPELPYGWDSLTTGKANGGGVLGTDGSTLFGSNSGLGYSPLNSGGDGSLAGLFNSVNGAAAAQDSSQDEYGGNSNPKERAMYGALLNSMMQYVGNQADGSVDLGLNNGQGYNTRRPHLRVHGR